MLAAALIPAIACEDASCQTAEQPQDNELGVLLGGLGADIAVCTNAGATLSGTTLTLDLVNGEDAVVSVVSNNLEVNGHQCMSATGGTALTASTVTRLVINGEAAGAHRIVLDLWPGSFGNIFGTAGGITRLSGNTAADVKSGATWSSSPSRTTRPSSASATIRD